MSSSNADKKPENVARGLKAAIHNDNVSEEAKENAAQRLEEMGVEVSADFSASKDKEYAQKSEYADDDPNDDYAEDDSVDNNEGKLDGNRRRGYKATLKNPNVSEKAKQHAKQVLQEADE